MKRWLILVMMIFSCPVSNMAQEERKTVVSFSGILNAITIISAHYS